MNRGPFLVTTPIYYVNDVPHIGHAYTTIAADAIARFQRLCGRDVFFLTGTDEHGKKIETAAKEKNSTPQKLADEVSPRFQELWKKLSISNDDFIRTTEERHKQGVRHFWKELERKGQIYLGDYEGLYCTPCEAYYTEKELENGNCPVHKRPVERLKESTYFFKMGALGRWLHKTVSEGEFSVEPAGRRNEILSFVDEGLKDLSVSRTTFDWGIKVPGNEKHVVYVWVDALLNYLTALGYPDGEKYKKFWAKDAEVLHLVGKDILRFHAVYWPTQLHAAGLRLPSRVFAHGWWTIEGQKMSKSLRNVVDPNRLIDAYGADEIRYFLLREVPFGEDGNFSHEALAGRIIGELANTVGNLANRVIPLVEKNFPGVGSLAKAFPKTAPESIARDAEGPSMAFSAYARQMSALNFSQAIEEILVLARSTNDLIQHSEPWKLAKEGRTSEVAWVLGHSLQVLDTIAVSLYPFLPSKMQVLWRQLGREGDLAQLRVDSSKGPVLPFQGKTGKAEPLFMKREDVEKIRDGFLEEARKASAPAAQAPTGGGEGAGTDAPGVALLGFEDFMKMDLRVARIAAAFAVPKAKKLLRLEVDCGPELGLRQVVAGIALSYTPEEIVGRKIVVVSNLKPAQIMGVDSQGMLLAAEGEDGKLSLVDPGERAKLGVRVK